MSVNLNGVAGVCRFTKYRGGSSSFSGMGTIPAGKGYDASRAPQSPLDHSRNTPSVLKLIKAAHSYTLEDVVHLLQLLEEIRVPQVGATVSAVSSPENRIYVSSSNGRSLCLSYLLSPRPKIAKETSSRKSKGMFLLRSVFQNAFIESGFSPSPVVLTINTTHSSSARSVYCENGRG